MSPALRALLGGIIDYAGLFPPAKLPLETAIRNYARYRTEPESWMLGRFVIPAANLEALTPIGRELFRGPEPFCFSVLGRGGKSESEFREGLTLDLRDIWRFRENFADNALLETYEVRLPALASSESDMAKWIVFIASDLAHTVEESYDASQLNAGDIEPFFESQMCEQSALETLIRALARQDRHSGFKLRTGGLQAGAFPSAELVARALAACRAAGVPFKATAGLHHPTRRFNSSVQCKMHGFLNVFGAGSLASTHKLSAAQVQEIIADEDPTHFSIDQDGFLWKDMRIATADIERARHQFVTSFGSCSFDEPRDDLRRMNWL